jgi:DNA-binding HxlR family transcriptional regulator
MKQEKDKTCTNSDVQEAMLPIFDALDALRGRWRLPILISLGFGKKRFSQISKDVTGISDKILAKELKELETNQLIKRTVYDTFPPSVDYTITEHGKSSEKLVIELRNWGVLHRKKIIGV